MQFEACSVAVNFRVHVFRGVLCGAKTESVQTEGEFINFAAVVVVLASGVHFAEDKLPVVALFIAVVIHRNAAAEVLDLHRTVGVSGDNDL